MQKTKAIFFIVVALLLHSFGNATAIQWQQANEAYQHKQYDSAKILYQQILQSNKDNAAVLYNLGNTYFRVNDYPHAILYYQKVVKLQPNNKMAKQNLTLTQSRIEGGNISLQPIFFERWWNAITQSTYTNIWALLGLLFFVVIFIAAYLGKIKKLSFSNRYITGAALLCIICMVFAWFSFHRIAHYNKAVVMQQNVVLLQAPKETAKILGGVPAGSTVTIANKEKGFAEVQMTNGRIGWLALSSIEEI